MQKSYVYAKIMRKYKAFADETSTPCGLLCCLWCTAPIRNCRCHSQHAQQRFIGVGMLAKSLPFSAQIAGGINMISLSDFAVKYLLACTHFAYLGHRQLATLRPDLLHNLPLLKRVVILLRHAVQR